MEKYKWDRKFNKGDKVIVIDKEDDYYGKTFTIARWVDYQGDYELVIPKNLPSYLWGLRMSSDCLKKVK